MMDVMNIKTDTGSRGLSVTSMLVQRAVDKNQEMKELREVPKVDRVAAEDKAAKAAKDDKAEGDQKAQAVPGEVKASVETKAADVSDKHVDILV